MSSVLGKQRLAQSGGRIDVLQVVVDVFGRDLSVFDLASCELPLDRKHLAGPLKGRGLVGERETQRAQIQKMTGMAVTVFRLSALRVFGNQLVPIGILGAPEP